MKRILYATIFIFCFNILQSVDIKKIKNKAYKRKKEVLIDTSDDGIRHGRQWHKHPINRKLSNWRRAESIEKIKYQDEFRELYRQKKKEAFHTETPKTDVVNMVAARPWGVPCGDPGQLDMPWGNCLRPGECAPEYRVHRGDFFCGRTTFVCCALVLHDYDPIEPLDASFGGSDFEVPLAEKLAQKSHSGKNQKAPNRGDSKRRQTMRRKRKARMRKLIKRIVREIKKTFENQTRIKKDKTQKFKKFLKRLKRKYDKSRLLVKDQHRETLNKTDRDAIDRVEKIYEMNKQFIKNMTDWRREVTESQIGEDPDPPEDYEGDTETFHRRKLRSARELYDYDLYA